LRLVTKRIVLPVDVVVAKKFEAHAPARTVAIEAVGTDEMILDIGPDSAERWSEALPLETFLATLKPDRPLRVPGTAVFMVSNDRIVPTPLLHNIKAMGKANRPFNISQPAAGMKTERTFSAPEVMLPFECNVHGWMHAYAGVLPYPFFATTGTDGRFTIEHLPPGTYTIEAWQEKYGTRTATVTVAGNETKTVDFTYTPLGA